MWTLAKILAAEGTAGETAQTAAETAGQAAEQAETQGSMWTSNEMIALYIAIGVAIAAVVVVLIVHKTIRTRLKMKKVLREDPDVNDYLIVFNWTPKVLYVPTMVAAVLASILMFLKQSDLSMFTSINAQMVGGVWFGIFFLNFLIEEYSMSIKVLLIALVTIACMLFWLHLLGWVRPFFGLFRHLALSISATGYLLVALIGLLTVAISWFKGLFYYVTITPNYMNLQEGPTESGEQISREDYNTRIDTSDFLERLLGFGQIVITFRSQNRQPLTLLVWRIDKNAQMLERVRAKFAIDYPQQQSAFPPPRSHPLGPSAPAAEPRTPESQPSAMPGQAVEPPPAVPPAPPEEPEPDESPDSHEESPNDEDKEKEL